MTSRIQEPTPDLGCRTSVIEIAAARAADQPDRLAYFFLKDGASVDACLTHDQLHRQARAVAGFLQGRLDVGERALLLYPPGLEFVRAFWGCLYAGIVPVPAPPVEALRLRTSIPRIHAIVQDAQAGCILTTSRSLAESEAAEAWRLEGETRWMSVDAVGEAWGEAWRAPDASPDRVAYLQYTSGSTSAPKGVMVTHGNLLRHADYLTEFGNYDSRSVILSWMPHFHDYGLVQGILHPLLAGIPAYLMPPLAFLKRPIRWLQAIGHYGITHSGGPNFAYAHCVRSTTPEERRALNLASWRVASCGAEPISPHTLESFVETFAPAGFRREALFPAYGMAEHTLLVSIKPEGIPPRVLHLDAAALQAGAVQECREGGPGTRPVVSCGRPVGDTTVVIVDPTTRRECPPNAVGEIWLAGASVAKGYWNRPEETAETFGARVAGTGAGPYLRTGDLGFVQAGRLYVTGRLKDLIIIRGRNHYPQDIEQTVQESHPALRTGRGAAFSIERNDQEQLVIVQEIERRELSRGADEIAGAIRQAVSERHDLQVYAVVLVRGGSLPKTTSGKIQRRACRTAYVSDQLAIVGVSILGDEEIETGHGELAGEDLLARPESEREPVLVAQLERLVAKHARLPASRLDSDRPMSAFGVDSLAAVALAYDVERRFGVSLPPPSLLDGTSIRHAARRILGSMGGAATAQRHARERCAETFECPLSHNQSALWFLHQLAPESASANAVLLLTITGALDAQALRRALRLVSDRHAALRTSFSSANGVPLQRVHSSCPVPFEEIDASSWTPGELRTQCLKASALPFDLTQGPMWRAHLYRRSARDAALLLVAHHIVVDGWSMMVLLDDLRQAYRVAAGGGVPPPALPVAQYADFVQWQRELLHAAEGQRLSAYWRRKLSGRLPVLDLPHDRPRPSANGSSGAWEPFALDEVLTRRLRALARREGATLYATLLAALQALLHRYTGQDDILIGSPMLGRGEARFARTVGDFVNVVVIRESVSGDAPFAEHLARSRQTVLEALTHQDYPFSALVEQLQPTRDLSRAPLVQVVFVLQQFRALTESGEAHPDGRGLGDLPGEIRFEPHLLPQHTGQFDVTIEVADVGGRLAGYFEYRADLFEAATIKRMRDHFVALLEGIVEGPDQRVADLPMLTAEERRQIVTWNGTRRDAPETRCLHELIDAQARRTPQAQAVVSENGALTYEELHRRANQVGQHLRGLGVGPDVLVGLCLERSLDLIVGLLGILKAGGAYVPLDPDDPKKRLETVLDDAGVAVVLTQEHLRSRLPAGLRHTVCLDTHWSAIARESPEPPAEGAVNSNLAYAIWTSGTSGQPKGVMVEHRAVVNYTQVAARELRLTPEDRVLQFASISFDAAAEEIFPCLASGATLVLRTGSMSDSVPGFLRKCAAWGVTVLDLPTAYWHALTARLEAESLRLPPTVRAVVIGGERAVRQAVVTWQRHVGSDVRLLNTYGPTEATIAATVCDLSSPESLAASWREVPIGRPIRNVQVYVLDRNMQPAPVGVPGELYIGGVGLARGYLNRPDITAARFVADPFGDAPGARLYRTGDLVRWLPDGRLEFVGRLDRQVKINGHRIELEEIETALEAHPDIRQGVVEVREDLPGDKRLVAFIVGAPGSVLAVTELREHLRDRLPAYMIPSTFVELDVFPLTASGKIDREALHAPLNSRARIPHLHEPYVAPRTPTEFLLAQVWGEILEIKDVGIHDNFFEVGGHSLLATQLFSRIRSLFQVEPPLRTVFENPTIAGLAEWLDTANPRTPERRDTTAIVPVPRGGPLPLSYAQERMWFLHALAPESSAYTIPAGIRLSGPLDTDALVFSLNELVRRHESLRTTFREVNGRPVQIIHPFQPLDIHEVDLASHPKELRDAEALRLVSEAARRPFDLTVGPLIRVLLIGISEEDHILAVITHHIVADQWSYGIVGREIVRAYNAVCAGCAGPPESPLAVQYADFAVWQREWLCGRDLQDQLAYWEGQLAEAPALALPTDRPRPANPSFRGTHIFHDLPNALVNRLKQLSIRENATLYMVFLTGFVTLLHRLTGQQDVVVGTPIANRNRLAVEGVIGTFVNTLALRTDLAGEPTFRTLLARVREVALGAYAHQDVPFEKLIEALNPDRSHGGHPLIQVLFNFANTPFGRVDLRHLSWSPIEVDRGAAQFDLSLSVDPTLLRRVYAEFNTDLFDRATVARWLSHYATVLEAVADDPDAPVSRVPLLREAERRQIVVEWNETRTRDGSDRCLPQLFEDQADRTPAAVAVEAPDATLTYAALNRRANQIAHYLKRLGVQPDDVVGVYMERSAELLACLLGVQKAGAAYLPLSPGLPVKRLHYMLQNSDAAFALTRGRLSETLSAAGARVVDIDRRHHGIERESPANLPPQATPRHLAYVIYTSGSTGQPKGVEIEHGALANFLQAMQREPGVTAQDRLLAVTTVSFDIAALELFLPLTVGGAVLLASQDQAADGAWLRDQLDGSRVSVMQATPATWQMVVQAGWRGNPRLTCLCGGETLSRELAAELVARAGAVWNLYGPTETTIWSTLQRVTPEAGPVSIGRPIANTQVYVLDRHRQPVPVGVPGELYIGGVGVARGYRHAPELTAAKFCASPVGTGRVYRTGDVARWRPDGRLDCLGRLDHQVKLRGFRIELGEIEAVLGEAPEVRQCVVVPRDDGPGERRLVGYVVPEENATLHLGQLRQRLKDRLPDYMVPAVIVPLDALPLTANGKIDRLSLPAPSDTAERGPDGGGRPRTRLELQLAAIWEQVLGIADVGVRADFFDLGGHSLLALRMMGAIEQSLGRRLPLSLLFRAPTIELLAETLGREGCEIRWDSLVAIQPGGARPPLFAVPGVGGNVLVFSRLSRLLGPDQPLYGLQARGLDGRDTPFTAVADMAAHYVREVRTVQAKGPYLICGTCTGGVVAYEMAQQLSARGERVTLAILESWHPRSHRAHRSGLHYSVWPAVFVVNRLFDYCRQTWALPYREWPRYWREKLGRLAALCRREANRDDGQEIAAGRVQAATFLAVSRYEPQPFRGRLLNVIASKRPRAVATDDTRMTWSELALEGAQTVFLPAEDAGRLFVFPLVQELAQHLSAYIAQEAPEHFGGPTPARRGNTGDDPPE